MHIKAEPYDFPYDGDLTAGNTALLVIDMQTDFCRPGGFCDAQGLDVSRCASIIPNIQRLLEAARKVPGFTIIHTREGHRADLSDLPGNKLFRTTSWGSPIGAEGPLGRYLTRGSKCWEIVPELTPLPGEPIIDKCGKGSFTATDLEEILRLKGIRNLILTGVTTECCVHTTMRTANDLGFECTMLEDCTQSANDENYDYHIWHTRTTGLFGTLSNSGEVIAWLESLAE